jgi:PAS domain S-box-containing protein
MKPADLHILMLEDEPLDAELNIAQLALLEEYNCLVEVVGEKDSYLHALETTTPDIILSDYNLPQYNGLEALRDLRARNMLIPFIFVTGTLNEETAVGTIKAGAWDYVVKDRLFRLPLAIRSVLKLKEEKLIAAETEERIKLLIMAIEQTSSQVVVSDKDGRIEYVNKKFTEVTGYTADEVLGTKSSNLFENDLKSTGGMRIMEKLSIGEIYQGEILSRNKDGSAYWESISIAPIKNTEGIICNYVAVMDDITLRKIMEQDLIEARERAERSDKLKDVFLQNLSHEIRTPLNAIVGFSHLLHSGSEKAVEKIKEYTSIVCDSSNHLLSIVTDILTIASIQTGQETTVYEAVDLNKLGDHLYEVFLPQAKGKGLAFTFSKPRTGGPFIINTDETKLNQILTNLLNNAIKFTHRGSIELTYRIQESHIDFLVTDTGIGIPKESQGVIFERFRQAEHSIHTNYGGTGLGLSISGSFAQMLGGTLRVESEQDKGSTFILTLPYSPLIHTETPGKRTPVILTHKRLTLLVAEDEIFNFLLIKAFLKLSNIELLHAENGSEALKLCEGNPQIDLVLMDIKMPVMDGVQAFREIRKIRKDLPVIAQTAYALEKEKQEFLKAGFNDYIAKPIEKEKLLSIINAYSGSK